MLVASPDLLANLYSVVSHGCFVLFFWPDSWWGCGVVQTKGDAMCGTLCTVQFLIFFFEKSFQATIFNFSEKSRFGVPFFSPSLFKFHRKMYAAHGARHPHP